MLSWPSSHLIRYRGEGSARSTSSTTPRRGWRFVDSDSATTRLPTSKAIAHPSFVGCFLLGQGTTASPASRRRFQGNYTGRVAATASPIALACTAVGLAG